MPSKNDSKCFTKFKNVEHLKLHFGEIKSIDKDLFNSFENLTNLELELRSLKNLPEFSFTSLTKLKELSLALDETKLNKNHFKGLQNLEALRLTGIELDEDLDCFSNLKDLKLKRVKLNKFTLHGLETLEIFNLDCFKFTLEKPYLKFQRSFFQNLKNLKSLDIMIREWPVNSVPEDCDFLLKEILRRIPTNIETLNTNVKFLKHLDPYSNPAPFIQGLKHLKIIVDDQKEENVELLKFFKEISFKNLESLELTSLSDNQRSLKTQLFKEMRNLKSLKLLGYVLNGVDAEFNYLTKASFKFRLPQNISNFVNLKSLSLDFGYEFITINERFLEDLVNLEDLALSCVFNSIDPNVQFLFKTLIKLKKLDFYRNKMHVIKSSYFKNLVNLEEVKLESCEIKVIEPDAFFKLTELKQLDLSGNYSLENIKKYHFASNPRLERIIFGS